MSKFKFIVCTEYTICEHCYVKVEAESLEKAIEMCKNRKYDIEDSEMMFDTMEPLPGMKIFDDDYNLIYSNSYDF